MRQEEIDRISRKLATLEMKVNLNRTLVTKERLEEKLNSVFRQNVTDCSWYV